MIGIIAPTTAMHANLTSITWAHAVNNQSYLDDVLKSKYMDTAQIKSCNLACITFRIRNI